MNGSEKKLGRWVFTASRMGQSGRSGHQTWSHSPGLSQGDDEELGCVTSFTGATPGKDLRRSFGVFRLASERWVIFSSQQGIKKEGEQIELALDDLGRPTYISEAFILSDLGDLPLPPYAYLDSPSFLKPLTPEQARQTEVPALLAELPVSALKPNAQICANASPEAALDWLRRNYLFERETQVLFLCRTILGANPAEPKALLISGNSEECTAVFAILWELAAKLAPNDPCRAQLTGCLSLCTFVVEGNNTPFVVAGRLRNAGQPSPVMLRRFVDIFSWSASVSPQSWAPSANIVAALRELFRPVYDNERTLDDRLRKAGLREDEELQRYIDLWTYPVPFLGWEKLFKELLEGKGEGKREKKADLFERAWADPNARSFLSAAAEIFPPAMVSFECLERAIETLGQIPRRWQPEFYLVKIREALSVSGGRVNALQWSEHVSWEVWRPIEEGLLKEIQGRKKSPLKSEVWLFLAEKRAHFDQDINDPIGIGLLNHIGQEPNLRWETFKFLGGLPLTLRERIVKRWEADDQFAHLLFELSENEIPNAQGIVEAVSEDGLKNLLDQASVELHKGRVLIALFQTKLENRRVFDGFFRKSSKPLGELVVKCRLVDRNAPYLDDFLGDVVFSPQKQSLDGLVNGIESAARNYRLSPAQVSPMERQFPVLLAVGLIRSSLTKVRREYAKIFAPHLERQEFREPFFGVYPLEAGWLLLEAVRNGLPEELQQAVCSHEHREGITLGVTNAMVSADAELELNDERQAQLISLYTKSGLKILAETLEKKLGTVTLTFVTPLFLEKPPKTAPRLSILWSVKRIMERYKENHRIGKEERERAPAWILLFMALGPEARQEVQAWIENATMELPELYEVLMEMIGAKSPSSQKSPQPVTMQPGDGATLQGDGVTLQGDGVTLQGDGATLQGDGATLQGDGVTLQGDGATPPGDGTTPPGGGATPPGGGATPPGGGATPPGGGATPPGGGTTPPGGGTTPPGDGATPPGDGATPPGDGTTPGAPPFQVHASISVLPGTGVLDILAEFRPPSLRAAPSPRAPHGPPAASGNLKSTTRLTAAPEAPTGADPVSSVPSDSSTGGGAPTNGLAPTPANLPSNDPANPNPQSPSPGTAEGDPNAESGWMKKLVWADRSRSSKEIVRLILIFGIVATVLAAIPKAIRWWKRPPNPSGNQKEARNKKEASLGSEPEANMRPSSTPIPSSRTEPTSQEITQKKTRDAIIGDPPSSSGLKKIPVEEIPLSGSQAEVAAPLKSDQALGYFLSGGFLKGHEEAAKILAWFPEKEKIRDILQNADLYRSQSASGNIKAASKTLAEIAGKMELLYQAKPEWRAFRGAFSSNSNSSLAGTFYENGKSFALNFQAAHPSAEAVANVLKTMPVTFDPPNCRLNWAEGVFQGIQQTPLERRGVLLKPLLNSLGSEFEDLQKRIQGDLDYTAKEQSLVESEAKWSMWEPVLRRLLETPPREAADAEKCKQTLLGELKNSDLQDKTIRFLLEKVIELKSQLANSELVAARKTYQEIQNFRLEKSNEIAKAIHSYIRSEFEAILLRELGKSVFDNGFPDEGEATQKQIINAQHLFNQLVDSHALPIKKMTPGGRYGDVTKNAVLVAQKYIFPRHPVLWDAKLTPSFINNLAAEAEKTGAKPNQ